MKQVTRYENSINTIPMRQWTSEEQNFFFAILTQLRDEGSEVIRFDKAQLQEFANYSQKHGGNFRNTIKSLADKVFNLQYIEETSNSYERFLLFQNFKAKWDDNLIDMTLEVRISHDFKYIVNQLKANFTQFELEEFTNIRSTYAKTMFRHLKQWRTKGVIGGYPNGEIPKEDLFIMLDVPQSMQRANNFNAKVLKPINEELSPLFKGLKISPIKAKRVGNPIIAYRFSWQKEETGTFIENKFNSKKINVPEWSNSNFQNTTPPEKILLMKKFQELSGKRRSEEITLKELKELEEIERDLRG